MSAATRRLTRRSAVLVVFLALTGCGGGERLADRDPAGARACSELAKAIEATDGAVAHAYASGEAALESTTPAIRAAAVQLPGHTWAHAGRMLDACRAEGVEMPDVARVETG